MNRKNITVYGSILLGSVAIIASIPMLQNRQEVEAEVEKDNSSETINLKLDFKNKTSEDMRNYYTDEGQEFIKKILPDSISSDFALLNVGKQLNKEMKDITFTTVNNTEVKLKDLKGKKILIDFALTSCGTCEAETKFMSNYNFKGEKIEYLHVFPRDNTSEIKSLFEKVGAKYDENHIVSATGLNGFEFDDLSITNVPAKIFIDEQGIVQYAYVGGFNDEETLQLHLERAFDKEIPKMLDYLKQ